MDEAKAKKMSQLIDAALDIWVHNNDDGKKHVFDLVEEFTMEDLPFHLVWADGTRKQTENNELLRMVKQQLKNAIMTTRVKELSSELKHHSKYFYYLSFFLL
ncbi:MAG: hypothetical protein ACRBG0_28365 [Lewinella sp.]|uniref:hypothetical protein n=1 Tax=Lewinella sp. TaxID=2004506 RepID=UPI003D6B477F